MFLKDNKKLIRKKISKEGIALVHGEYIHDTNPLLRLFEYYKHVQIQMHACVCDHKQYQKKIIYIYLPRQQLQK